MLENKPPALVDTPGGHYGSALRAAVHSLSSETVWALLEEKANPNVKNKDYGDLLDEAAGLGSSHRDIVRDLISAGAEADLSPKGNELHIMHRAAMFGMIELTEHCLEKKCQIDLVTTQGPAYNQRFGDFPNDMTPLAYACAEGHAGIVDLLLSRNASFELEKPNSAVVWLAALQGHAHVVDLLLRRFKENHSPGDTAQLLLQRPHAETKSGQPILVAAASSGSADTVKVLIEHGAKYESNSANATPLYATATFGCPAVTELLLDYDRRRILDICINQQNVNGKTALFEACSNKQTNVAKMLLDAGADYLAMDKDNTTPLQVSCFHGNFNMVLAIVKRAAQELDRPKFLEFINNRRRRNGNVALIDCAERDHLSCLNLLLDNGADYTIPGNGNYTILHMASRHDNSAIMAAVVLKAAQDLKRHQFLDFLNTRHSSGKTALIDCAERGRQEATSILLNHGADYKIPGHAGNTPLHWSCMGGYREIVETILKRAKSEEPDSSRLLEYINAANQAGITALMEAARRNHLAVVKVLLSFGADYVACRVDRGPSGVTALHDACYKGCREVAIHLLEVASQELEGERFVQFVNARNNQGKTPLHDAASTGRSRLVRLLVGKYNADYTISTPHGHTPLHMASFSGHIGAVSALLETALQDQDHGGFASFLDHKNRWYRTALYDACHQGHTDVIRMLLDHGADYTAANDNGVTPLHVVSWQGPYNAVATILDFVKDQDRAHVTSMLLDRKNKWNKTPLMDACETGRPEIAKLLLEHGTDYRVDNGNGSTALHYCVSHNRINCVRVLLEYAHLHEEEQGLGEFINQQAHNNGASALHDAVRKGYTDIGLLLLRYKPVYDSLDSQKRSPLHHAAQLDNRLLVRALLERAGEEGDKTRFTQFISARDENGDSAWKGTKNAMMEMVMNVLEDLGYSAMYEELVKI